MLVVDEVDECFRAQPEAMATILEAVRRPAAASSTQQKTQVREGGGTGQKKQVREGGGTGQGGERGGLRPLLLLS